MNGRLRTRLMPKKLFARFVVSFGRETGSEYHDFDADGALGMVNLQRNYLQPE